MVCLIKTKNLKVWGRKKKWQYSFWGCTGYLDGVRNYCWGKEGGLPSTKQVKPTSKLKTEYSFPLRGSISPLWPSKPALPRSERSGKKQRRKRGGEKKSNNNGKGRKRNFISLNLSAIGRGLLRLRSAIGRSKPRSSPSNPGTHISIRVDEIQKTNRFPDGTNFKKIIFS